MCLGYIQPWQKLIDHYEFLGNFYLKFKHNMLLLSVFDNKYIGNLLTNNR